MEAVEEKPKKRARVYKPAGFEQNE